MEDEKLQDKVNVFEKIKKLVKSVSYEDLAKKVGAGVAAALIAATVSGCQPAKNNAIITQAQEAVEQEQSDGTVKEFFKTYGIEYTPIDKSVLTSGAELVPTGKDNPLPSYFVTELNGVTFVFNATYSKSPTYSCYDIYWLEGDRVRNYYASPDFLRYREEGANSFQLKQFYNPDMYSDWADYLVRFYSVGEGDNKTFIIKAPEVTGVVYPITEEEFDYVTDEFIENRGNMVWPAIPLKILIPSLNVEADIKK